MTGLLAAIVRKVSSEKITRFVAVGMAAILLVSKVAETVFRTDTWGELRHMLPLHLCDIAAICTGIMLINRNYRLYEVTYFWALAGTLQALLTPDLPNAFPHVDFLFYFFTHGLIIVGVIYATVLFKYRPTLSSIGRTIRTTLAYAAVMAPINWLFDVNYLYLCHKPLNPSLFDYLGPWPWYLVSVTLVGVGFFFLYYSPFWVADLLRKRKGLACHCERSSAKQSPLMQG